MEIEVKQKSPKLDRANALGPCVKHCRHEQQGAKAFKSMGEQGDLSKNSPNQELNREHGNKK